MSKRPLVIFGILAVICVVGLPFWALAKVGSSDASPEGSVPASDRQGLELFQINCGACHTLAAAGTDGIVGPDLDVRFGTGSRAPWRSRPTDGPDDDPERPRRPHRPGAWLAVRNPNRLHPRDQFTGLPLLPLLTPALAQRVGGAQGHRSQVRLTSPPGAMWELRRAGFTHVRFRAETGRRAKALVASFTTCSPGGGPSEPRYRRSGVPRLTSDIMAPPRSQPVLTRCDGYLTGCRCRLRMVTRRRASHALVSEDLHLPPAPGPAPGGDRRGRRGAGRRVAGPLLEWAEENGAVVHSIDPSPKLEVDDLAAAHPGRLHFHRSLSLDVLGDIEGVDVALIDGDHNWYTVLNELRLLRSVAEEVKPPVRRCPARHRLALRAPRPLLRPRQHPRRPPQAVGAPGIVPVASSWLAEGINGHLANAASPSPPANGVLTAVEDFIAESHHTWRFHQSRPQRARGAAHQPGL